jgi:hypothetical protein
MLLKDFKRVIRQVKEPFITQYGAEHAERMVVSAQDEFYRFLPDLPSVGGKQPFTQFVISSGWFLAFYKAMRAHGAELRETGEMAFLLSQTCLQRVPNFAVNFWEA